MTEEQLELFEKYKYIVYKCGGAYKKYDYDDAIQEGFAGLIKGIEKLDTSKGVDPVRYLYKWVKWSMHATIKKLCDVVYCDDDELLIDDSHIVNNDYDAELIVSDVVAHTKLTKRERDVVNCSLDGLNPQQISQKLNKNTQYIRNVKARAISKLKITAKERGYVNE